MHMKKILIISAITGSFIFYSCGSADHTSSPGTETAARSSTPKESADNRVYDPERGAGKFTHVDIPEKLDASMASSGQAVYELKCSGCHKVTEEKLVGPGWKGVTKRQKPEWIMNFITNTDEMIDKDPKIQAQLELCLIRMPNQSLNFV
jgi:hypothetical protein